MIDSTIINKAIKQILSPVLKENGFSKVQIRNNWGWHDECVWVLNIRAVGNYFSQVTGWPPMSIRVGLGIYYEFQPSTSDKIKRGSQGELFPGEEQCHKRTHLSVWLDQSIYKNNLENEMERKRNDIWWIEPNGSNVVPVVEDIKKSFLNEGLGFLKRCGSKQALLDEITAREKLYEQFPELRSL